MPSVDEAEINDLLLELIDAWNRGDVDAYGVRYCNDATFTNVNGMFHVGREQFDWRNSEIFAVR